MVRRFLLVAFLLVLVLGGCAKGGPPGPVEPAPSPAPAPAPVEPLPTVRFQPVASGLTAPVYVTHAGDGSGRLFILEKPGRIRVVKGDALLPAPFLDITRLVNTGHMERGLLGLAFHPRYRENGLFYVHYTGDGGQTVIARYRVSSGNPDVADAASASTILTVPQPYPNHNGGSILFGPDGYLYIALGDGGAAGDPQNRAQNLNELLGKLLRIDVGVTGGYRVPADNPLVGRGRGEIWAYGLRNPWRVSFDRATGDLWIADVGQGEREEVSVQPAGSKGGQNYGWKVWEGTRRYSQGEAHGAVFPVAEYRHDNAGGCAVTGGYVYRGAAVPALRGQYLFGDYCTGRTWTTVRQDEQWVTRLLVKTEYHIASFGEDEAGELYLADDQGTVYRIGP